MPGHQTWLRATIFIFSMPGSVSCSRLSTDDLRDAGTTTLQPQSTQLSCTEHSSMRPKNDLHSAVSGNRLPLHKASLTAEMIGSLLVACATAAADSKDGKTFSSMNKFPDTTSVDDPSGNGSRLSPSALPNSIPGRYASRY
uniref:Secreted protein n=1 Tax=Ixodes ricinus TaxID=34613 RepID=A0A6B0UT97_IXORI